MNTLVHRALMICSKTRFDSEFDKIKAIPIENGYPEDVISDCFGIIGRARSSFYLSVLESVQTERAGFLTWTLQLISIGPPAES